MMPRTICRVRHGPLLIFHCERPSETDSKKSKSLFGVEIEGRRVVGPLDDATCQRIDKFVRFAVKLSSGAQRSSAGWRPLVY